VSPNNKIAVAQVNAKEEEYHAITAKDSTEKDSEAAV